MFDTPGELVPIQIVAAELNIGVRQLIEKYGDVVARNGVGLTCIPGAEVLRLITERDEKLAKARAKEAAGAEERAVRREQNLVNARDRRRHNQALTAAFEQITADAERMGEYQGWHPGDVPVYFHKSEPIAPAADVDALSNPFSHRGSR